MQLKSTLVFAFFIMVLGALFVYKKSLSEAENKLLTIGIIQTATHPALDQAREGFISEINSLSQGKVRFVIQNFEGSLSQAQSIADNFHIHKKIDAIFAIGTPAVQAISRVEKRKPIFFTAVTDPESLGLIYPGSNVCGTTDQVDSEKQVDLILEIIPNIHTVSIIYNPAEHNSQMMVNKMKESLQKRNLQSVLIGVHSESEIAHAVSIAARKGELILIPLDNLLAGSMSLVAREAIMRNCPLFVSDIALIKTGALMALGTNYSELGQKTASMTYKVLFLGNTTEDIGIVHPTNAQILVNKDTLKKLEMVVSKDLLPSITFVSNEGDNDVP